MLESVTATLIALIFAGTHQYSTRSRTNFIDTVTKTNVSHLARKSNCRRNVQQTSVIRGIRTRSASKRLAEESPNHLQNVLVKRFKRDLTAVSLALEPKNTKYVRG